MWFSIFSLGWSPSTSRKEYQEVLEALKKSLAAPAMLSLGLVVFQWTVIPGAFQLLRARIKHQCHHWTSLEQFFPDEEKAAGSVEKHMLVPTAFSNRHRTDPKVQKRIALKLHALPPVESAEWIAEKVLVILQRCGQHTENLLDGSPTWKGRDLFLPKIVKRIRCNQKIDMILPAFPWKSINTTTKVLSHLPDLGEFLAMARLNQLCEDIRSVYSPGAAITIATDGVVFDDVVGIPDKDTWMYGAELVKIITEQNFSNLKLRRVMEMMGLSKEGELDRAQYLSLCAETRAKLLSEYGRTEAEVRAMVKSDRDTRTTYCGFIRFLETDLRYSNVARESRSGTAYRKKVKKVAVEMMIRAESFTKFLQSTRSDYVRLSIHPSSGTVKLSVPLILQANGHFPRTPWHCCIAVALDGSYRTCHVEEVQHTHRLIFRNGRPHYYREKSPLWDWESDTVLFEPQYPRGLIVRPLEQVCAHSNGQKPMLLDNVQIEKLNRLSQKFGGRVVARGFANSGPLFCASDASS